MGCETPDCTQQTGGLTRGITLRPIRQKLRSTAAESDFRQADDIACNMLHLTVGGGFVWVGTASGAIMQIDPRTNSVAEEATISLPSSSARVLGARVLSISVLSGFRERETTNCIALIPQPISLRRRLNFRHDQRASRQKRGRGRPSHRRQCAACHHARRCLCQDCESAPKRGPVKTRHNPLQ
jgi:hypothetical protein